MTTPPDGHDTFRSLNAMRKAHTTLLQEFQKHDEDALPPEFIAAARTFLQHGQASGVLMDVDEDRADAQTLLNYWTTVLYAARAQTGPVVLAPFDVEAASRLVGDASPYVGLRAFGEGEGAVFFGRRRLVQRMVDRLRAHRFLAVVGLSGSGKSSIVRAGLLPALREGSVAEAAEWRYLEPIVPGTDPIGNLAAATCPPGLAADRWRKTMSDPAAFVAGLGAAPVLLVVDQLEELFTLTESNEIRETFIALLCRLPTAEGPRHTLIVTLRRDFEESLARYPALQALFTAESVVPVPPLDPGGLRNAIEGPAARLGVSFEPGLVQELVQQVLGEPAGLPLLQFTLLKLWSRREGNRIPWKAYKDLGGNVRKILADAADEVYESFKLEEDRQVIEKVFVELAALDRTGESTSRRKPRAAIYPDGVAPERTDRILDALVEKGLLRVTPAAERDHDQIEVTHEALLRNWPTLAGWLADRRVQLRKRHQLTTASDWWRSHGEDRSGLLRGLRLAEAEQYDDLTEDERRFVTVSRRASNAGQRNLVLAGAAICTIGAVLVGWGLVTSWEAYRASARAEEQTRIAQAAVQDADRAKYEGSRILRETEEARRSYDGLIRLRDSLLRDQDRLARDRAAAEVELAALNTKLEEAKQNVRKAEQQVESAKKDSQRYQADLRGTERMLAGISRPMLRLDEGKLDALPPEWQKLLGSRMDDIIRSARSVGVLRLEGGAPSANGFMVASDVVATFWGEGRGRAAAMAGKLSVTFSSAYDGKGVTARTIEYLGGDEQRYLAFYRVKASGSEPLPPPLRLDFDAPAVPGAALYIIGYPISVSQDSRRLQPGYVTAASVTMQGAPQGAFVHDCSTAGGNAGAPVFDAATGRVIGIHWGATAPVERSRTGIAIAVATLRPLVNQLGFLRRGPG